MSKQLSNKLFVTKAIPLILANLLLPLIGLLNLQMIRSTADSNAIAAIGIGSMVLNLLYLVCNFPRLSTTGLTAHAHGIGDDRGMMYTLARALLIALITGVLLIALRPLLISVVNFLLNPAESVEQAYGTYVAIRILAAPAVMLNFVFMGWFIGRQKMTKLLLMTIFLLLVLCVLSALFVLVFRWGLVGTAVADVIAQYALVGFNLYLVMKKKFVKYIPELGKAFRKAVMWRTLGINLNIMLRTFVLAFTICFFTRQSQALGATILAANGLLLRFETVLGFIFDAFANVVAALAGEAFTNHKGQQFFYVVRKGVEWYMAVSLGFCLLMTFGGGPILRYAASSAVIAQMAKIILPMMACLPFVAAWPSLLDGVYIGTTLGKEMRNTALIAVMGFFLPAWYLTRTYGNLGLWFAMLMFYCSRGIIMAVRLRGLLEEGRLGFKSSDF